MTDLVTQTMRWTTQDLELLPDNGKRYEIIDGEQERQKTEEAVARAERLEKLLREAGIDPEQID